MPYPLLPSLFFILSFVAEWCSAQELPPLQFRNAAPGIPIKPNTTLRILPVGDSITVGFLGDDLNSYREKLRNNLSADNVTFAGTEIGGTMDDPYFSAWAGKTIQYISDRLDDALAQRPNIILLHAGTNDMNPDSDVSHEGHDANGAAHRLGALVDKMFLKCPDAVILVAMIIPITLAPQMPQTKEYQELIPAVVQARQAKGKHVFAVDFTKFPTSLIFDGVHPSSEGYRIMGDWWYDFITQIPRRWITAPVGPDPKREKINKGGPERNIPPLKWAFAGFVLALWLGI